MLTRSQARSRATVFATSEIPDMPLRLVNEVETPYGWVFIFNTVRYEETGDLDHDLVGLGPLLVLAGNGELHELRTGSYLRDELKRIESRLGLGWDGVK